MGYCLGLLGRNQEAKAKLEEGLKLVADLEAPSEMKFEMAIALRSSLAQSLDALGLSEESIRNYDEILKLNPPLKDLIQMQCNKAAVLANS